MQLNVYKKDNLSIWNMAQNNAVLRYSEHRPIMSKSSAQVLLLTNSSLRLSLKQLHEKSIKYHKETVKAPSWWKDHVTK